MKKLLLITSIFLLGCSTASLRKKGSIEPIEFKDKVKFTTIKSVIIVPAQFEGERRGFLFDTGAPLNIIQRDSISGKKYTVGGASNRTMKLGSEKNELIQIGATNFTDVMSWNGDLMGLKEQVPDFGGIIGQSIIGKANWKIDYPNKTMEFSNSSFVDATFTPIEITNSDGKPYTIVTVEGKAYKAIIDLGSSSPGINVPDTHPLAKKLLSKYNFTSHEREIFSMGGLQLVKEKKGVVPLVKLGASRFANVPIDIRNSSQLRIGMNFFKDCVLLIDNSTSKSQYFFRK